MDFEKIATAVGKWFPFALLATLIVDWVRLRANYRREEKKHIACIIPELLDLRLAMLGVREFPKLLPKVIHKLLPSELRKQIPPEAYSQLTAQLMPLILDALLPLDANFGERYRRTVHEIAGFRPLFAYQLRGKERYFDLRALISDHLAQMPDSQDVSIELTSILHDECLPVLDETIMVMARAHSYLLYWRIKRRLQKQLPDTDPLLKKFGKVLSKKIREQVTPVQTTSLPTEKTLNLES